MRNLHIDPNIDPTYWWRLALALKVSSALFADGGTLPNSAVFNGFGLTGGNVSPDLTWTAGPAGTKSYVTGVFAR
jgi:phosphatidylethanolamine-binding protein (PEBP) family uncharacterized protein